MPMKSDQVSSHSLEGLAPFTIAILIQLYRPPLVLNFSNVATNIFTLTAVLMGLRSIGNFFCHVVASRESSQGIELMMLRPCSIVQIFCHGAYAAIQYGEL